MFPSNICYNISKIIFAAYTSNIPKPHINDPYNGRTVVGGKIHLECSIRLDTMVPFTIEWEYPNKNIKVSKYFHWKNLIIRH